MPMRIILITLMALALSVSVKAQSSLDTCVTRQVFDSLTTGHSLAKQLHESGYIQNLQKQVAVQRELIETLSKVPTFEKSINDSLKEENKQLKAKIKANSFQLTVGIGLVGMIGYSLGTLKR